MKPLRVLLTNNTLSSRAGSELYLRDVAAGLLERGHVPITFSMRLGDVAKELRTLTVPVVTDLNALGTPPDVIHGQHHLETMLAVNHFPSAPAVFFCHGWIPWEETPPVHPRITRYVAVSDYCRDRLHEEHGIPADSIRIVQNFIDERRFTLRPPLPERPRRALIFNSYAAEHCHIARIREACDRRGIEVDLLGTRAGNTAAEPGLLLHHYDLVFATGRSALEALAVGCSVVLFHIVGSGPLVASDNLDRLMGHNFGLRALQNPLSTDALVQQIDCYNADDAGEVSARVRSWADRNKALDRILAAYHEAMSVPPTTREAECLAFADYLRFLEPSVKDNRERLNKVKFLEVEQALLIAELNRLKHQRRELEQAYRLTREEIRQIESSATMRLRSHILRFPFVGWMKNLVRRRAG